MRSSLSPLPLSMLQFTAHTTRALYSIPVLPRPLDCLLENHCTYPSWQDPDLLPVPTPTSHWKHKPSKILAALGRVLAASLFLEWPLLDTGWRVSYPHPSVAEAIILAALADWVSAVPWGFFPRAVDMCLLGLVLPPSSGHGPDTRLCFPGWPLTPELKRSSQLSWVTRHVSPHPVRK